MRLQILSCHRRGLSDRLGRSRWLLGDRGCLGRNLLSCDGLGLWLCGWLSGSLGHPIHDLIYRS